LLFHFLHHSKACVDLRSIFVLSLRVDFLELVS
jgi:hypothetical protein